MRVSLAELQEKVLSGVTKLGYTGDDAAIISDILLYAQLRGNNQGITKIATGGVPKAADVEELRETRREKCGALLSGGHSMTATARAADLAVELAAGHGVGIVGVNHTFTSSGAIGYFSRRVATQGYISFVCTGNGDFAFVAPAGSAEPKLGTNPFSYAFPYTDADGASQVVVFDTTTAAMAFFGIVEAKLKGEALPAGIGFDQDGNPSSDAAAVLDGSVATFAAHKGFGLSLLVQLLGGPLVAAGTAGSHEEDGSGTFVLAIDPGLLAGREDYLARAGELVRNIKAAKPLAGQTVWLPGEQGDAAARQAADSGELEIADAIWDQLCGFVDNYTGNERSIENH